MSRAVRKNRGGAGGVADAFALEVLGAGNTGIATGHHGEVGITFEQGSQHPEVRALEDGKHNGGFGYRGEVGLTVQYCF